PERLHVPLPAPRMGSPATKRRRRVTTDLHSPSAFPPTTSGAIRSRQSHRRSARSCDLPGEKRFDVWFRRADKTLAGECLTLVLLEGVDGERRQRLVVVAVERAGLRRVDAYELAALHLHTDEARTA